MFRVTACSHGCAALFVAIAVFSAPARADLEIESRGELGFETRVFWPASEDAVRDATDPGNVALAARLQVDAELSELEGRARVFSRLDPYDGKRTVLFPEELWLSGEYAFVRLRLGYQMLNWTATEAFHPADIINSRILDGSFENPEKLGELIASLRFDIPGGNVELMWMPLFTEPVLPSSRSRLNLAPTGVQLGEAWVLNRDGEIDDSFWQLLQWGARIQQTIGDADLSVHFVQHIDRALPLVGLDPTSMQPRPIYQAMSQVGGTYLHVFGRTLVKLEAAYRRFDRPDSGMTPYAPIPERDFVLTALGFEHGLSTFDSAETSLLLEGQVLIPTQDDYPELLEPLFQHDVLVGVRHAFNDAQSTTLLLTAIVDVVHPDQLVISASVDRRLGDVFSLHGGVRVLRIPPDDPDDPQLYERMNDAHHVFLDLKRHF